jgi:hypothetical protein
MPLALRLNDQLGGIRLLKRHVEVHDALCLDEAQVSVNGLTDGVFKLSVRGQFRATLSQGPGAYRLEQRAGDSGTTGLRRDIQAFEEGNWARLSSVDVVGSDRNLCHTDWRTDFRARQELPKAAWIGEELGHLLFVLGIRAVRPERRMRPAKSH